MPNIRAKKTGRWPIGKHEFYTVYHYALQYPDWLDQYNALTDSVASIAADNKDGSANGNGTGNPTQSLGIKRAELSQKMDLIMNTAKEADPDLWPWIMSAVTGEYVTYTTLKNPSLTGKEPIPCGRDTFYDRRRKFYYLLSRKKLK